MDTDHGHCEQCERNPYWLMADSDVLISVDGDVVWISADGDDDDGPVRVPSAQVEQFCREFLEHLERRRAEGAAKEANRA